VSPATEQALREAAAETMNDTLVADATGDEEQRARRGYVPERSPLREGLTTGKG
jgi:hypothetical protein